MSNEKTLVPFDPEKGFLFSDLDGMYRAAEMFLQTGFAPKGMDTPQKLCAVWWRAAELGIPPLQAMEGMNVINGRLGIGGDLALAKVRSLGLLVKTPKKVYSGTQGKDDYTCTLTIHRKGEDPQDFSFSVAEAKQAGIYANNWPKYPQRMTYYRALGWGLRDIFPEVLRGMYTSEELEDFEVAQPPLVADEAKVAENQAAEDAAKAAGVVFVKPHGKRPTPKEAVEPAFPEDAQKPAAQVPRTPAFAEKLDQEFPEDTGAAELAARKDQLGAQQLPVEEPKEKPKKAEPKARVQEIAQEVKKELATEEPDDLDMTPVKEQQPEAKPEQAPPARPAWMDHVIRSIPHPRFQGKKISELDPKDLAKIETQWIPKIQADMESANADQRLEYKLFQSAIAHGKAAKPF